MRDKSTTPYFERFERVLPNDMKRLGFSRQSTTPSPNDSRRHSDVYNYPNRLRIDTRRSSSQSVPRIKLNISLTPDLKLREYDLTNNSHSQNGLRRSISVISNPYPNEASSRRNSTYLHIDGRHRSLDRGASPFTYIETSSIKRQRGNKNRVDLVDNLRSPTITTSPLPNKEVHKTLLFTKVSPNDNNKRSIQDFENNEFKAFERECEELRKNKLLKIDNVSNQYDGLKHDSEIYLQDLTLMKTLLQLLDTINKRLTKIEEKLCNQESCVNVSSVSNLTADLERLIYELDDLRSSIRNKQDESLLNQVIDYTDLIRANKTRFQKEFSNLNEILFNSELLMKRYKELSVQLVDRETILNQILRCTENYKKSKNIQTNWIESIEFKITTQQQQEKLDNLRINNDNVNHLKQTLNSNSQILSELGAQENQIDDLNEIGIKLIKMLKRYNQLLNDYRQYTSKNSDIATTRINNTAVVEVVDHIRRDINELNREYGYYLREYNNKIKSLANNVAKTEKHFTYHIGVQNVETLIEKYSKELFERYELIDDLNEFNQIQVQQRQPSQPKTIYKTIYHTTYNNNNNNNPNYDRRKSILFQDLMDINTINIDTNNSTFTTQYSPSINSQSTNTVRYYASKIDQMDAQNRYAYPLTFIDAVNRKQLDLENGYFKEPNTGSYTLRISEALQKNLLNPKSAYIYDTYTHKNYYLDDAIQNGIINAQNRIVDRSTNQTYTLSDALKSGYLKLGDFWRTTSNSCSLTSETQSMSVRSIKDPSTGEFLIPTEAIKRKILDPYKGLFIHPITQERLQISDAIKKGYVIVEMISDLSSNTDRDGTNLISTNLVRETKSYHLLGVYDPTKNDEITIKEAISRGILDRQRGLYIHPITGEYFSISDAINKGVIRARILLPPSDIPSYESSVSTNRFQENKTYTICGAIDPRTNKPIGLNQAIRDGIINTNNGTYVNIVTGEIITLNVAIERNLIITEIKNINDEQRRSTPTTPTINREVKTLTIEFVLDPRSGRNISVTEAMQNGLLDRQSFQYHNPLTNENYSLNKAYERGYIIGHYTDSHINETIGTNRKEEKAYFIISVLDPRTNKSLDLDQAIQLGLFDHNKAIYIHPINKEIINLNDAIMYGFIDAKIYDNNDHRYDKRLPIGDFGIDKKIKSVRTKFNSDGTSVLQIDIENTKPTKGIYEVDEIEELTIKEPHQQQQQQQQHRTEYIIDHNREIHVPQKEYRQVVDINSVYRIPLQTTEDTIKKQNEIYQTQIDVPISTNIREKNILVFNINKEIGADFKIERNEKIIDDDDYTTKYINIKNKISERPSKPQQQNQYIKETKRVETLVIDDIDNKRQRPINIDGQTHSYKNEIVIDSHKPILINNKNIKTTHTYLEIDEASLNDNARKVSINDDKNKNLIKFHTEIIDDTKKPSKQFTSIDDKETYATITRKEIIEINDDHEKKHKNTININDENKIKRQHIVYEDVHDINKEKKKDSDDEWYTETFEQDYLVNRTVQKKKEKPIDEIRTDEWIEIIKREREKQQQQQQQQRTIDDDDDDEELYEEWTEIYTITIRGIKYKITWVYDANLQERIPLISAIKKGIIDLNTYTYKNFKTGQESSISDAIDDGLIGIEEDKSALHINVNGISYTIYWVWDPVKKKRISPKRAIDRGVLDLKNMFYRNYSNNETINIHEAIHMKLIGASEDLSNISEDLIIEFGNRLYKIVWVKDSRNGEKLKPREALRRALLDLTKFTYRRYDTNEILTILDAIEQGFIGILDDDKSNENDDDDAESLKRQDSLLSLDDDELTIKTKTAIYVITGLLHPITQKEIKVTEAIESGILDKETGSYKDFKTNVVYEVGEAINEGILFATVTDLLQDQSASTEVIREEIKRYIVRSVIDPRTKKKIGGLQAQGAGILNYAQGMYTNPDTRESIPIGEAISKGLIRVSLQEESSHEEFDAEVVTETLMERCITNYRIFGLGVLDPISHQMITGDEAVHKQVIDTETNSYVDANEIISLKEAVNQHKVKADVSERIERKSLGLSLQNAIRLGLFTPDNGTFKDPYTNKMYKLNEAIEMGHINPNGAAIADSTKGMMTLNEAFECGIFDRKSGWLNKTRLAMFKARLVDSKIYKLNFEDTVKCGIVNLKTGKYKHMQSGELISIKDAIQRGLIDGESTIIENPTTNTLMTLRKALDMVNVDDNGNVFDPNTNKCITTLESAFNTRKIFSAFDENTGEIFLISRGRIVPFEKAVRKNKMDKDVKIFDPTKNKELSINDAIEHGIIDKSTGMVIEPKSGSLLSIKEACKRGILSISGAPVVTGHHDSETIEKPTITSKKTRHLLQQFDDVHDDDKNHRINTENTNQNKQTKSTKTRKTKTQIIYEPEDNNLPTYLQDPNNTTDTVTTKVKETTEEYRKKIRSDNTIVDQMKTNYKEGILELGQQARLVSSSSYEFENKIDQPTTTTTSTSTSASASKQEQKPNVIQLNVNYETK